MFQYTFIYQLYFFIFFVWGCVKIPSIIGNTSLLSYEKIDSLVGLKIPLSQLEFKSNAHTINPSIFFEEKGCYVEYSEDFKDTLSVLKSSEIAGIPHHLNAMIHLNDSIVIALNDSFLIEIRQKQIVKKNTYTANRTRIYWAFSWWTYCTHVCIP